MHKQAREVTSTQTGPHEDLLGLVAKHAKSEFKRPIAEHTQAAFEQVLAFLADFEGEVIIDACCGVGESTLHLASRFPNAKVIGIDKSQARVDKHGHYLETAGNAGAKNNAESTNAVLSKHKGNHKIVRADLNDFWRLLARYVADKGPSLPWKIVSQYLLYPNPYPKKAQVGKRWHAGPVFSDMLRCCRNIEVRSNWKIYIEEFVLAAGFHGVQMQLEQLAAPKPNEAFTPFERKYAQAGQALWRAVTLETGSDR